MRLKDQMLVVAAAYCAAIDRTETWISTRVFGSGKRLRELREGADSASGRVEDALQWFSDRWPEGTAWPAGIARPEPAVPPEAPGTD